MKRPGTGARGMSLVGYLIFALSLALMFVMATGLLRKPAAPAFVRPAELKRIECRQDPRRPVQGDDFVRVAGTVVALPCVPAGTWKDTEQEWKRETDPDRMSFPLMFTKLPDGRFVAGNGGMQWPKAADARYLVETYVRLQPFRPFSAPVDNRVEISVPTPSAFAASGAQTTFVCSRPIGKGQECRTKIRSKALYWGINVQLGWPYPKTDEWQAELAEALDLVAAHVVKQD